MCYKSISAIKLHGHAIILCQNNSRRTGGPPSPLPLNMLGFDGNYASKRKVDLRGNSKKDQDKQSFLDKQKQEREKRHQEKQRLKAAVTIQAFYRGRKIIAGKKQEERSRWDQDIKTGRFNAQVIASLVRNLLFFYNPNKDGDRLQSLASVILDNIIQGMPSSRLSVLFLTFSQLPRCILLSQK